MVTWLKIRAGLACGMILTSAIAAPTARAKDAPPLSTSSRASFDLATYREMKQSDKGTLGLILTAMRETVFYAQKSMGTSVVCASPRPIPATELIERVDKEITTPTNPLRHKYEDNDQMAFIFVSAMKNAAYCE
jgi:hypothetical protein